MTRMSIAGGLVALLIVGVVCFFVGRTGQKVVHADGQELAQAEDRVQSEAAKSVEGIANASQKAKSVAESELADAAASFGGAGTWIKEAEAEGIEFALAEINGPLGRAQSAFAPK